MAKEIPLALIRIIVFGNIFLPGESPIRGKESKPFADFAPSGRVHNCMNLTDTLGVPKRKAWLSGTRDGISYCIMSEVVEAELSPFSHLVPPRRLSKAG